MKWGDNGVPYHFGSTHAPTFEVASATVGGSATVLTVDPNVLVKMEKGTSFIIGVGASPDATQTYPGAIVAVGTATNPIRFTSAAATPAAGDWLGFLFEGTTTPANDLEHVSIEYAGGSRGGATYGCVPVGDDQNSAIVISTWVPPGPFLSSSAIVKSAGHGVLRGWSGGSGPAFLTSNTFDVGECPETPYRDSSNACPAVIMCQ